MVNPTGRSAARRTTVVLFLILLTTSACSRNRAREDYQQAWGSYVAGKLAQSAEEASRGAAQWASQPDSPWYHRFRLLRAEALQAQGNSKAALELLHAPIAGKGELEQLEVRRLIDLATISARQKAEATEWLRRAREKAQDPEMKVRILNTSGLIALANRENEAALSAFQQAASEAANTGFPYWQAQALNNSSVPLRRLSRYEDAVDVVSEALAIAEKAGARRILAQAHGNLGATYSYLGETAQALEHEQGSVKANEVIGDRVNLAVGLGELGLLHDRAGEPEKGIPYLERAYTLTRELGREEESGRHAENLATALIRLQRWDEAERWNQVAEESITRLKRTESMPYLIRNQARIQFGHGRLDEAVQTAESLLRSKDVPPDIAWAVHSLLGEIAAQRKQYARANREFDRGLKIIEGLRSDLVSPQYRITLLSRLIVFYRAYVDLMVRQGDDTGALRIVEASRARVLAERLGRSVAAEPLRSTAGLKQFARENRTVLLSFWFAPDRSFAWLIDGEGVRRFDLPGAAEVERQVTAYREIVEHSLVDPLASGDASAAALWRTLMERIAAAIPAGARVIVIPDGPLHRMNLETLVAPKPKPHYWIGDVEIAVAPSVALAVSRPQPRGKQEPALLLIGAPDYSGTRYEPLAGAEGELREIPRHFAGAEATFRTGRAASPAAYSQSRPERYSLIHFAAHAEANDMKPLESAVVLSRGGGGQKLYAREVIDLPIHADLVTLSACRSAGTRAYAGEGLIGFVWAFLQAGARSVVAGLWEVSDSSSAPLMDRFYAGVGAGESPAHALREAKLALAREPRFRKPFFWGPFQVYVGSAAR